MGGTQGCDFCAEELALERLGEWQACKECAQLANEGNRRALETRAMRNFLRTSGATSDVFALNAMRKVIRESQAAFFATWQRGAKRDA